MTTFYLHFGVEYQIKITFQPVASAHVDLTGNNEVKETAKKTPVIRARAQHCGNRIFKIHIYFHKKK